MPDPNNMSGHRKDYMKQKTYTNIAIVLVIAIVAVIIIAAFQTKFFSEASLIDVKTIECKINLVDSITQNNSGEAGSDLVVNLSNFTSFPAGNTISIKWNNSQILTSFSTDEGIDQYSSNAQVPSASEAGTYSISASGNGIGNNETTYNIYCDSDFIVTAAPQLPAPTTTTTTTPTTSSPTTSQTTPTTPAQTTTAATSTTPLPSPTQTTATIPSIIAPLPIITAPAPISQTPEPAYSIPPVFTPTPTPDTTAVPIIAVDDDTGSIIEADKDEISANGEDKTIISVTLKDNKGNIPTGTIPTIEVTGNYNTVSELIKEGEEKYSIALSSTRAEEKTVKVKAGDKELPQIKISAKEAPIKEAKQITTYYQSWWFWLLIILGIVLVLVLSLSYRHKLHSQEL